MRVLLQAVDATRMVSVREATGDRQPS
jgi:hypothetical protein